MNFPKNALAPKYTPTFKLGCTYLTSEGKHVRIEKVSTEHRGYECVRGDDGIWRYDRKGDVGRVTGTRPGDPRNLTDIEVETWEPCE